MQFTATVRSSDNVLMRTDFEARTVSQAVIAMTHMEQWAAQKTAHELYAHDYVRANPYNLAASAA